MICLEVSTGSLEVECVLFEFQALQSACFLFSTVNFVTDCHVLLPNSKNSPSLLQLYDTVARPHRQSHYFMRAGSLHTFFPPPFLPSPSLPLYSAALATACMPLGLIPHIRTTLLVLKPTNWHLIIYLFALRKDPSHLTPAHLGPIRSCLEYSFPRPFPLFFLCIISLLTYLRTYILTHPLTTPSLTHSLAVRRKVPISATLRLL